MKRILYMILMVMLFGTAINVLITLNQIQINTQTKTILNGTLISQQIGLENQKIIINNQKDIFKYSQNATAGNMKLLQSMIDNQTNFLLKNLK